MDSNIKLTHEGVHRVFQPRETQKFSKRELLVKIYALVSVRLYEQ